jgi:hypothetical protein
MNRRSLFDDFSKLLARGLPRRAVIRGAIGLTVAGIFHAFGWHRLAYAAAPPVAEIQEGDFLYYNCKYQERSPGLITLNRDGCGDPLEKVKSICVGDMDCDVYNTRTRQSGRGKRRAVCDANRDSSCPDPVTCDKAKSSLVKEASVAQSANRK